MKNRMLWYLLLFLLLGAGALFLYEEMNVIKVTASELSADFAADKTEADKKYLNRTVDVTGKVKAFYTLLETRDVLEFNLNGTGEDVFCFFLSAQDEFKASQLQEDQIVKVRGKCVGMDKYAFVKGVKIEVDKFVD